MKTKLTLTVRKSVIITAKKYARHSGKSISRLFEEPALNTIKSEQQRAAGRLLKLLESSSGTKPLRDKVLLKKHIESKYA